MELEEQGEMLRVRIDVHEVRKGMEDDEVDVHTPASGALCGFPFREDETYLVFAYQIAGTLDVSLCGRSRQVDETPYSAPMVTILSVDPAATAMGFPSVHVEFAPSWSWSFYLGSHVRAFDGVLDSESTPYRSTGVEVGVRYFPSARAPLGSWFSARAAGAHLLAPDTTDSTQSDISRGGYISVLGGYSFGPLRRLILSGGLGVQYVNYEIQDFGFRGIYPAVQMGIGYWF